MKRIFMQVYLNTMLKLSVGQIVELPPNLVLFQELTEATEELEVCEKGMKTYSIVFDEPIHDPLIREQVENVYKPMDNGLYADHASVGLRKGKFLSRIKDPVNSRGIFETDLILDQIHEIGFKGVWVFENRKRLLITVSTFEAAIIRRVKV